MKQLLTLLILFTITFGFSQNDNPYAKFGYKGNTIKTPQERMKYMLIIQNTDTLSVVNKIGIEPKEGKYYFFDKENNIVLQDILTKEQISRFFAIDPLASDYPWNSPYAFSENDVIGSIELEGLEKLKLNLTSFAPFDNFGGGFTGDGNKTGFALTQNKYKLSATTYVDVAKNSFYSQPTLGTANSEFKIGKIYSGGIAQSETNIRTNNFQNGNLSFEAFAGNDAALQPLALAKIKSPFFSFIREKLRDVEVEPLNSNIDFGTNVNFSRNGSSLTIVGNLYGDKFPSGQATISDQSGQSIFLGVSPINTKDFYNKETAPFQMLPGQNKRPMGTFNITVGLDENENFNGNVINNSTGKTFKSLEDFNKSFKTTPSKQ